MRLLQSLVLLALLVAGGAAWAGLPTFELTLSDGRISSAVLQVPANERVKIILHNTGSGPSEFESTPLRIEKVLGPGVSSFVVLPPLKPGRYPCFDDFHLDMPQGVIEAQ